MHTPKHILLNLKYLTFLARYSILSQSTLLSSFSTSSACGNSTDSAYNNSTNTTCKTTNKWTQPTGFDTGIKIYNPITKAKEKFIIKNKNFIKWYACGPTVYDSPHLGHAVCNVRLDILRRILEQYFHLNTVVVSSVTDIDDKIINKANSLKEDFRTVAKKYELEYVEEMEKFNVIPPTRSTRVSEFIPQIIDFVKQLVDEGKAYVGKDGSVYFDTENHPHYYKMCGKTENSTKHGIRKSAMDFTLWKAAKENEPFFESYFNKGRPGWHIECSAMASHFFGPSVDLHTGGIDLKFPHHENEEAQSCAYHNNSQWVNYWLHTGHMRGKDGTKMSKSLGNFVTVKDYLKKHKPDKLRMMCLITHYKSDMDYNEETLTVAHNLLEKFRTFVDDCNDFMRGKKQHGNVNMTELLSSLEQCREYIHESLTDDFNTPKVVDALQHLMSTANVNLTDTQVSKTTPDTLLALSTVSNYILSTFHLMGLELSPAVEKDSVLGTKVNAVLDAAVNFRTDVRKLAIELAKANSSVGPVLKKCDDFRDELGALGIHIKDQRNAATWQLKDKTS